MRAVVPSSLQGVARPTCDLFPAVPRLLLLHHSPGYCSPTYDDAACRPTMRQLSNRINQGTSSGGGGVEEQALQEGPQRLQ
jgi:hypothetical protein